MGVTIEPFPEKGKFEFEMIRENNSKEREQAMVEVEFLLVQQSIGFPSSSWSLWRPVEATWKTSQA